MFIIGRSKHIYIRKMCSLTKRETCKISDFWQSFTTLIVDLGLFPAFFRSKCLHVFANFEICWFLAILLVAIYYPIKYNKIINDIDISYPYLKYTAVILHINTFVYTINIFYVILAHLCSFSKDHVSQLSLHLFVGISY